jgi:hypothetical protein
MLVYLFGWATDWAALVEATRSADLPLFLCILTLDRLAFFYVWTLLQAEAINRFVTRVEVREIVSLRGGTELFRAVSNPLADAAFFVGLAQLTRGRFDAVLAAALIPAVCHFLTLLAQITLALPFLEGGPAANADVTLTAGIAALAVLIAGLALRLSDRVRFPGSERLKRFRERVPLRKLAPFFVWFVVLAAFDVVIQGFGARAFGIEISWPALMGRIPILYLGLTIPSLGNFGTRELLFANLFSDHGPREALIAYAFATNAVFLVLNVLIGVTFLSRALELFSRVRRAQRAGEPVPQPILHDPTDY